jgi:hypothetical protein
MRYNICIEIDGDCGGKESYVIKKGNVVPVTCDYGNCFVVDVNSEVDKIFEIEWNCGNYKATTTYRVCDVDQDCPNCEECVGGVCVVTCDRVCYGSACVDCLSTSDCPQGYVCAGNVCVLGAGNKICEDGSISKDCIEDCTSCQDYINGVCVEKECPTDDCNNRGKCFQGECVECLIASDCGLNSTCINNECVCAAGYRRDTVTGECVDDFNCFSSSDCPECHNCQQGKCLPVNCLQGMICSGRDCVYTCTSDFECPSGLCEDGICIGGISLCGKRDCVSYLDCTEGCGCDGKCVSCENYACLSDGDCPNGCSCIDGVCSYLPPPSFMDCEDLSCFDGTCASRPDCDCGDNYECVRKICGDYLEIEPIDCGIQGRLVSDTVCPCPIIGIGHNTDIVGTGDLKTLHILTELRKGSFSNYLSFTQLPLLSQTLVANDLPLNGSIRLRVEVRYRRSDVNGVPIGTVTLTQNIYNNVLTFIGIDSVQVTVNNVPDIGSVQFISGSYYVVTNIRVYREHVSSFTFPNGCIYDTSFHGLQVFNSSFTMSAAQNLGIENTAIYLNDLGNGRLPLLTFWRTNNINIPFTSIISNYGNSFDLFAPYAQQYRYYKITADCGCAEDKIYSCDDSPSRLVVCDDSTQLVYELLDCGTKFRFLLDVVSNCDIVKQGGTRYKLFADDIEIVSERIIDPSGIIFLQGDTFDVGQMFNKLVLKVIGDECEKCVIEANVPNPVLDFSVETPDTVNLNCGNNGGSDWTINFFYGNPDYQYAVLLDGNTVAGGMTSGSSITFSIPISSGTYTVVVADDSGCTRFKSIDWDPNVVGTGFTNTIQYSCNPEGILLTVTTSLSGTVNVDINGDSSGNYGLSLINGFGQISLPRVEGETWIVNIESNIIGCDNYIDSFQVDCCPQNPFPFLINPNYFCSTGLTVTTFNGIIYTINGDEIFNGDRLSPGVYVLTVSDGECTRSKNITVPECYSCFGDLCLPDINGVYNDTTCNNDCDEPTPCAPHDYVFQFNVGEDEGCDLSEVELVGTTSGVIWGNLFVLRDYEDTEENWALYGTDEGSGIGGVWDLTCFGVEKMIMRVNISRPGCPDEWLRGYFYCENCQDCDLCLWQVSDELTSSRILQINTSAGNITFYDVSYWIGCVNGGANNPDIENRVQEFLDANDDCEFPTASIDNVGNCVGLSIFNSSIIFSEVVTTNGTYTFNHFCEMLP